MTKFIFPHLPAGRQGYTLIWYRRFTQINAKSAKICEYLICENLREMYFDSLELQCQTETLPEEGVAK